MHLRHPDLPGVTFVTVASFPPGGEPVTVLIRREDGQPFTWKGQTAASALLDARAVGTTWQEVPITGTASGSPGACP
jgi:hypothetical protein